MTDAVTKGEMHGCIVCGKLYNLYVVYDADGNYMGSRVMSAGGHEVKGAGRPLVACDTHSEADITRAVETVYGYPNKEDD
jgi:hypothetical protein